MTKLFSSAINFQKLLLINAIAILLIKLSAWRLTNSLSILADTLESGVNILAGAFTLYSLYLSEKPRDANHPYGHGKIEFIAAVIEGTLIFLFGLGMIVKVGYSFYQGSAIAKLDIGLLLVAVTAALNLVGGIFATKIGTKKQSAALTASGAHLKVDSYSSITVLVGLMAVYITDYHWIDKLLAALMGLYMCYNGAIIIRRSIGGVMDEVDSDIIQRLVDCLQQNRRINWVDLHKVRFIKFGGKLHLDCHLTLPWYFNLREAHQEIDYLQEMVNEVFGDEVEIFVHTDDCHSYACPVCIKHDCQLRKHEFDSAVVWDFSNVTSVRRHSFD